MYLSQLDVGGKLEVNPVAQQLLLNLIRCGAAYQLEFADVAAVIEDEQLAKAVDAIGLQYAQGRPIPSPPSRIPTSKIALVSATPANLKQLAEQPRRRCRPSGSAAAR